RAKIAPCQNSSPTEPARLSLGCRVQPRESEIDQCETSFLRRPSPANLKPAGLDETIVGGQALRQARSAGFVLKDDPPEQLIAAIHGRRRRRTPLTHNHKTRDQAIHPHPPPRASER